MSIGKLVIHPRDARAEPPELNSLIESLRALELVGSPVGNSAAKFLVGERFLRLITFLGCSPHIELDPPADGSRNFCHISILGPFQKPQLLHSKNTHPPRCPSCHKSISDWQAYSEQESIYCTNCSTESPMESIRWTKHAGFARIFIEISNVFPGEAIPVDELLNTLGEMGAGDWNFFYLMEY